MGDNPFFWIDKIDWIDEVESVFFIETVTEFLLRIIKLYPKKKKK